MRLVLTVVLLTAGLGWAGPAAAASSVEEAALDYITMWAAAWKDNPAEAAHYGFVSSAEASRAQVQAVFAVHQLDALIWQEERAAPIVELIRDTDLYWVVVGVDGVPSTVVSIRQAGGTNSAVGMGWVPADALVAAADEVGNEPIVVWVPEHVSVVLDLGPDGAVTVRPILSSVSAKRLGMVQHAALSEEAYVLILHAHSEWDINGSGVIPGGSSASARVQDWPARNAPVAVVAIVVSLLGLAYMTIRRRYPVLP